ncbi:hypothetical protein SAMN05216207_10405 [Pseudonocardia ammonioxydans]|uniref:Uncharacterized protein n=1 Tax=Pseudonocardia ammonioxydans TaxID=260086 RepID=A0A1I5FQ80_PSUAM|nr:hypothetical protein [Pseudonocardia ammonioxydans]SFO25948.1 hypothetical protein SAMN05216207_10405 [Pseudonocardia ammonioxydans]
MSTVTTSSAIEFSPVLGHHVYAGTDVPALTRREAEIAADLAEDELLGGQEPAVGSYGDEEPAF